jgi:hypothetical protein
MIIKLVIFLVPLLIVSYVLIIGIIRKKIFLILFPSLLLVILGIYIFFLWFTLPAG